MCGIIGNIYFNARAVDPLLLKQMTDIIAHRGPDDEGHVLLSSKSKLKKLSALEFRNPDEIKGKDLAYYNIGLGFRRLSIIDLSAFGHQPMSNEDGTIWIVFNGEFYNYFEYIDELKNKGHILKSRTDTEIIIHLYEEYGIDEVLKRINGMFAFALYDVKKCCLFLARDRVGIKPLYFYRSKNKLVFASEVKAILEDSEAPRCLDTSKIFELFQNRYINAPNTIFYNIKKVIPGTYWKIDVEQNVAKEIFYWSVFNNIQKSIVPSVKDYQQNMFKSINYRLRSDVPLGVFLSGGLDSSTICGLIRQEMGKELKTFSIEFDNESGVNESWASLEVANHLNTDHYGIEFKTNVFDILPKIAWHCEEPIADPALLPTYYLSKFTKNYVTVALSGEGSDETNYGYEAYKLGKIGRLLLRLPEFLQKKAIRDYYFLLKISNKSYLKRCKQYIDNPISWDDNEYFIPNKASKLFLKIQNDNNFVERGIWWKKEFKACSIFDINPLIHFHTWMQDDLLLKVDKMSMAHGLEVRVPYLDHNLVNIAYNIRAERKISINSTKCVLRNISKSYLPTAIRKRKQHGFLVPLESAFEDDLFSGLHKKSYIRDFLEPISEIIDIDKTINVLAPKKHLTPRAVTQLWLLMMIGLSVDRFRLCIK